MPELYNSEFENDITKDIFLNQNRAGLEEDYKDRQFKKKDYFKK